jgi:hypothetical protein
LPGVRSIRQQAPREMLVIADDAATATPRVADAIRDAGGDVVSSSEYRPNFDEVFSELVTRAEPSANPLPEGEGDKDDRVSTRAA